jgi:SAM-dependent MidA family methyltransferase
VTPLDAVMREIVAQEGPQSLERVMELALGHPAFGYYMTRDPFGAAGDFVTAPEISQMFGELIGLWAAQVWLSMGSPSRFNLVELGPGRGTLMADALRAGAAVPGFREAVAVTLVETSPVLRRAQAASLEKTGVAPRWADEVAAIPPGPAIILANEFFDALPARHYVRSGGAWRERLIGLSADGALAFGLAPQGEPELKGEAPEGAIYEIQPSALKIMATLARRLAAQGGALLAIDYGHSGAGFGETLQAVRAHRSVDPLTDLGECDLTVHVDFAALARAARAGGARAYGPITQRRLLCDLGIGARAERLARGLDEDGFKALDAALTRLAGVGPASMGELFKALAVTHPDLAPPPAFASMDA